MMVGSGLEKWYLAGLIILRSLVRIQHPLFEEAHVAHIEREVEMAGMIALRNEERDIKDLGKLKVDGKEIHVVLGSSDDLDAGPDSPFRSPRMEITQEAYKELINPKRVGAKAAIYWLERNAITASGSLPRGV